MKRALWKSPDNEFWADIKKDTTSKFQHSITDDPEHS